jgi:hypothetical protein
VLVLDLDVKRLGFNSRFIDGLNCFKKDLRSESASMAPIYILGPALAVSWWLGRRVGVLGFRPAAGWGGY